MTKFLESHPPFPKLGEVYFNLLENKSYLWDGKAWHEVQQMQQAPQFENLSPIDRTMRMFEHKVNSHPDMNVKMKWITEGPAIKKKGYGEPISWSKGNDPDYWLGVAYAAYKKNVITNDEMKDILLALQARGAKSDYFDRIAKEVVRYEAN